MENNEKQDNTVKAIILLEIDHVFMHRLLNKEKTLFTSGTCKIAKLESNKPEPAYFINIGSFYYGIHQHINFVKVNYAETVSYVFPHFESGLSAISLLNTSPAIHNLDQILSNAAKLINYSQLQGVDEANQIKKTIEQHYPNLEAEQIYYPDNIKKAITTSGKFFNTVFTTVGAFIKSGVQIAGNYINEKIDQGQPTHIAPQTKLKWQSLKNGTAKVFSVSSDYANKILTPVIDKTKEYASDLKTKIDNSNNETVKYAKQLVQVSGKAFEEAIGGLVKGGTEVGKEFGEQSKKIINKKYGQQVLNVITSKKTEEEAAPGLKEQTPSQQQTHIRLNQESTEHVQYPSLEK